LHSATDLADESGLPLFMTTVAVPAGQPLTRTLLTDLGKSHGMASLLGVGKVAVSFAVDPIRGVGGWIQPGDQIAIFDTPRISALMKTPAKTTRLLFPCVKVLAVDHKRLGAVSGSEKLLETLSDPGGSSTVLTVLLNPVEAARLIEAREEEHLSVILRPLGDDVPWQIIPKDS
jgi:Flp pilus assembly protein CpaB